MTARHRRPPRQRRRSRRALLAELGQAHAEIEQARLQISRLSQLLSGERSSDPDLPREVEVPGSEEDTVFIPKIKIGHTENVLLITPDGKRTTVRTGPQASTRHTPAWAHQD